MTIYTPYTYLIGWSKYNKWYYGCEYKQRKNAVAHPSNIWKTYFTSSKEVSNFRLIYGEPDIIEIRKTFSCPKKAIRWEHKVLTKIAAAQSSNWLNLTNGGKFTISASGVAKMKATKNSYERRRIWITNGAQDFYILEKLDIPVGFRRGMSNSNLATLQRNSYRTDEVKAKISKSKKGRPVPDHVKEKIRNTNKQKIRLFKDGKRKNINPSEKDLYIALGWSESREA